MTDNFYANWFSRTQTRRLTLEELWQRDTDQLRSMATSEFGEFCKERFNIPEVTEAEEAFKTVLQEITDPELRNKIDMAVGKISYAMKYSDFAPGISHRIARAEWHFFRSISDNLRTLTRYWRYQDIR